MAATLGKGTHARGSLLRLVVPTAAASAFLNNTPIVAMLVPQVTDWAERRGQSPSRYLMPLSFAAILGGVVTTIGTSTNLVISGLLEASGEEPLGMFEMAPVGVPVAVVGLFVVVALAPLLIPERRGARRNLDEEFREFVLNMLVTQGGPLDGKTVEDGGLRHLQGVFLVEIERGRGADRARHAGHRAARSGSFGVRREGGFSRRSPGDARSRLDRARAHGWPRLGAPFFEAVIGEVSPLVGKTPKEISFRARYQAAVVAIHRSGHRVKAKLGEVRLRVGDTLLILGDPSFRDRWRDRNDFLLVSGLGGAPPVPSGKAWFVGVIAAVIVGGAALGLMPILHLSLLGAFALVAAGVLTPWMRVLPSI